METPTEFIVCGLALAGTGLFLKYGIKRYNNRINNLVKSLKKGIELSSNFEGLESIISKDELIGLIKSFKKIKQMSYSSSFDSETKFNKAYQELLDFPRDHLGPTYKTEWEQLHKNKLAKYLVKRKIEPETIKDGFLSKVPVIYNPRGEVFIEYLNLNKPEYIDLFSQLQTATERMRKIR